MSDTTPFFRIHFDPDRLLLRWTLTGLWSEHVLRAFAAALARHVINAERTHANFASLGDSTDFPRQAPTITRALHSLANLAIGRSGRKIAIVTGRPLTRQQLERRTGTSLVQFFDQEDGALQWLGALTRVSNEAVVSGQDAPQRALGTEPAGVEDEFEAEVRSTRD